MSRYSRYGTYRPSRARSTVARQMTARYGGTCRVCGEAIRPGDLIEWVAATRTAMHAACTGDDAPSGPADPALARAVAAGLGEDYADDDADYRRQRARDEQDYQTGLAQGARYSSDRKLYGEALAEQWAMDDEMRAYNYGLDD